MHHLDLVRAEGLKEDLRHVEHLPILSGGARRAAAPERKDGCQPCRYCSAPKDVLGCKAQKIVAS